MTNDIDYDQWRNVTSPIGASNWSWYWQTAPTQYEYRFVRLPGSDDGEATSTLNALGAQGWELVAVDGGRAYFKRARRFETGDLTTSSSSSGGET